MIDGYNVFDFHVHIQPWEMMKPEIHARMKAGRDNYDELMALMHDPAKCIAMMDQQGIEKIAIVNYVSPDLMGFTFEANVFCSNYCSAYPDRLIPIGSVNPRFTDDMAADMDRLLGELGIRIFKVHPPHQAYYPNDYLHGNDNVRIIYEKALEYDVPVMFHTGTTIFKGARIKYGDPIHLDDVAIDFPNLKMILAHGGRPLWMDTVFFLLRRHPNLYMDISGFPPQRLLDYFPRVELVASKVLWGTDWPAPMTPEMDRNVRTFLTLPLTDDTKRKILYDNATTLLDGTDNKEKAT